MTTKADYTETAIVKDYLGITTSQENAQIDRLVTAASDWIDQYTGRTFGTDTGIRLINGNGQRRLSLPEDCVSISKLEVALYEGATYNDVPLTDFFMEPVENAFKGWPYLWIEFGLLPSTSVGAFYRGHRTVRLTGTWGWATVPTAVSEACVQIVAAIHKRRKAGFTDTVGVTELGTPIIGKFVPEYVRMSISMFRSLGVVSSSAAL